MSRQFLWYKIDNEDFISVDGLRYVVSSDPLNTSPKKVNTVIKTDGLRSLIYFITYNLNRLGRKNSFHGITLNKPHSSEWEVREGKLFLIDLNFVLPDIEDENIRNNPSKAASYLLDFPWKDPCRLGRNLTEQGWMYYYFQESEVFADWFSGEIQIPAMPDLYYPWMNAYVDVFDHQDLSKMELYDANRKLNKDIILKIDKGLIIATEEKDFESNRKGIYGIKSIIDPPERPGPVFQEQAKAISFWRRLICYFGFKYK